MWVATASSPADPSTKLLGNLTHGKTVVLLFAGDGEVRETDEPVWDVQRVRG